MREEYMSSAEITQEIADLKIRLALQLEFEEEVVTLDDESESQDPERRQNIRQMENRILQDISQELKSGGFKRKHRSLHKLSRTALIAVILLTVSISSALAALQLVRVGILKLDIQEFDERTSYGLIPSGRYVDVPEVWEGDFYPTYIPEGFELKSASQYEVEYVDHAGNILSISEILQGGRVSIDTENANVRYLSLNGIDITCISKDEWNTVVWSDNNRIFIVDLQSDEETALLVAASYTFIK